MVSAREANQSFSRVLGEAEAGEEVVITRHGKPVAVLRAYDAAMSSSERRAAAEHALRLMANAPRLGTARRFTRDEMHER
jgi:prevent-host-death family protein